MSKPLDFQNALFDAGVACARSATGAVQAAMVMAHLQKPPAGMEALIEGRTLSDAAALASTAAQAAAAARDIAQALDLLQARPIKEPAGQVPNAYPDDPTPAPTP